MKITQMLMGAILALSMVATPVMANSASALSITNAKIDANTDRGGSMTTVALIGVLLAVLLAVAAAGGGGDNDRPVSP